MRTGKQSLPHSATNSISALRDKAAVGRTAARLTRMIVRLADIGAIRGKPLAHALKIPLAKSEL